MNLVQYTPTGPFIHALGRRLAARWGSSCEWISCRDPWRTVADRIGTAGFVIIWSGMQRDTPRAARLCADRGIPHVFVEQGMLPQARTWFVDPRGFCGNSVLCNDLSWVGEGDLDRLAQMRRALQTEHPLEPVPGRVMIALQLSRDTQVREFSRYRRMAEFVEDVLGRHRGAQVIVRRHPRERVREPLPGGVELDQNREFLESARRATRVVSISSTCLYEAAVLGVPVEAWGRHPFSCQGDHDRVAAGAMALRVVRRGADIGALLARFGLVLRRAGVSDASATPLQSRTPQDSGRSDCHDSILHRTPAGG